MFLLILLDFVIFCVCRMSHKTLRGGGKVWGVKSLRKNSLIKSYVVLG